MASESALAAVAGAVNAVHVAVAIIVEGPRVLITKRPPGVPLAGLWEFPGGKIEPTETPAAAAVREVREELGLTIQADTVWPTIVHPYAHAIISLTPVLCHQLHGQPSPTASTDWKWVSAGDLSRFTFPDANQQLLVDVAAWLRLQTGP